MPYPLPLTRTEAYLAYKAGVIQQSDLKPSLAVPRNGIDAWLAYWTGLANYYPIKNLGKNIIDYAGHLNAGNHDGLDVSLDDATGQITVSGQPTKGYAKIVNTYDITNLLEDGKEYTISQSAYDKKLYAQVNAIPTTGTPTYIYSTSSAKTFTVDKTTYPRYNLVIQTGAQSAWAAPQTITRTFQIEKGSSASAFEPYTGEPLILQEEEAYIAYLCGASSEYPEKCLRRVGAYLRYLISARWGRPDHPLNREELYLSLIKTQFIPSGDPSSDITIDGTAKAAFVDVKMYGDTYQQSYKGKNLLEITKSGQETKSGIKVTWENSSFILDGTATTNIDLYGHGASWSDTTEYRPLSAGVYTMSIRKSDMTLGANLGLKMYNRLNSGQQRVFDFDASTSGELTFNLSEDDGYTIFYISIRSGQSFNNERFYVQLEKSNSVTSFEPFVGGTPSPNPDYPQQIQTVTGEQTVTVTGKNKINMPYRESEWNGASVLQNGTTLTMKPSSTGGISMSYSTPAIPVAIPTGETITWSRTWLGGGTWNSGAFTFPLEITYSDGTTETISLGDTNKNNYLVAASRSVTLAKDVVSVRLLNALCYGIKGMTGDIVFGVQLEYGSTATTYTPYSSTNYPLDLGSIELCKLGTYQDYIYQDGESWKVHKETKSVTLDENDDWSKREYGTNAYHVLRLDISTAQTKICIASQHFRGVSYNDRLNNQSNIIFADSNAGMSVDTRGITIRNTPWSDLPSFLSWISGKTIECLYVLLESTDTTITDTNLIAQLEALVKGGSEDGTTYIKVSATDHNLPGLLYVEAPKYE